NNVAVYWGQGASQARLSESCQSDDVDIINLSFVNGFPDNSPGGWPATNFGNACGEEMYSNNGVKTELRSNCPQIGPDIKTCQAAGKKVLLSIGGGSPTNYYINNATSAKDFAEFLWGAFGPQTDEWVAAGLPRPFGDSSIDGFDFDIESLMPDPPFADYESRGYADLINYLKDYCFPAGPNEYYISAAPQCIVPDSHLSDALEHSWIDFVFVQFYNTALCSARTGLTDMAAFTYNAWSDHPSRNPNVRYYIGLPASTEAIFTDKSYYLSPAEAFTIASDYYTDDKFGGIMLWESTYSKRNQICGKEYAYYMKDALI
ncbi:glycoside hydrolase, partial [Eremomyces bilateralis CBS 781.70]